MQVAEIVLKYLKVILSTQVVAGAVGLILFLIFKRDLQALLQRIKKISFSKLGEVETQSEKIEESKTREVKPLTPQLEQDQYISFSKEKLIEHLRAERAMRYLWEYRFLNFFLVPNTQRTLDWLASLSNKPSISSYHAYLMQFIPSIDERKAIFDALANHSLIQIKDELIFVTDKGREYIQWRGPLPTTPPVKT